MEHLDWARFNFTLVWGPLYHKTAKFSQFPISWPSLASRSARSRRLSFLGKGQSFVWQRTPALLSYFQWEGYGRKLHSQQDERNAKRGAQAKRFWKTNRCFLCVTLGKTRTANICDCYQESSCWCLSTKSEPSSPLKNRKNIKKKASQIILANWLNVAESLEC